jgi:hypothetical protein
LFWIQVAVSLLKPLLDPDGRLASETAVRRFQNRSGSYETVSEAKRSKFITVACDGHHPTDKSARLGVTVM